MDANCVTCRRTFDKELSNDSKRCPLCLLADGFLGDCKEFFSGPVRTQPFTVSELNGLFPDLEVIEKIGSGGMGEVYLAIQKTLNRKVALKILRPEFSSDLEVCERFDREARVMASLSHPNIVTIYEFGHRDGFQFLIIEYVEGKSLAEHLRDGPLDLDMGLSLIRQISLAVGYAHSKGVLHRDIKPGNVLVSTDHVAKIADFGLAKILRDDFDISLTVKNAGMGTPRYMAPEQSSSAKESDEKADIFSMAVVFHEMMTGHLPIGKTINISKRLPGLRKFDRLIKKSLDPDPQARPESALEFESSISSPKLTNSSTQSKGFYVVPALVVIGILIALSLFLYQQPTPTPALHHPAESFSHPVPLKPELPAGHLWNWKGTNQVAKKWSPNTAISKRWKSARIFPVLFLDAELMENSTIEPLSQPYCLPEC
ncbi:MAG: serine/threonine-protein kinase [Verrucomicrobiales bacterium]|nr:serine/threonine-protein kinase [Verrucomicrobiales bacterium]